MTFERIMLNEG